jgi:hypothetical protein
VHNPSFNQDDGGKGYPHKGPLQGQDGKDHITPRGLREKNEQSKENKKAHLIFFKHDIAA